MIRLATDKTVLAGAGLVVLYTLISAGSDVAAKSIALEYAAPQLFALSGGLVALFSVLGAGRKGDLDELRTDHAAPIAVRSVMTVISACLFFYAVRELPLAEVFVFVGLMPIMAALLTPIMLKERVNVNAWSILIVGFVGILCLFPEGISGISGGHVVAFFACLTGVISMVIARLVGKKENKPLALVFYPHLLMFVSMGVILPFVYKPMGMTDLLVAVGYSLSLFVGRVLLVRALAMAPTHVVMPIINVQFVWVVGLGAYFFAEQPGWNVYLGAFIVIASCIALIWFGVRDENAAKKQRFLDAANHPHAPRLRSLSHTRTSLSRSGFQSQSVHRSIHR